MNKIGILGAGTWGMALARMLTLRGNEVTVWSAVPGETDELAALRRQRNLPSMVIPAQTRFTNYIDAVCADKTILVFAVPSIYVRSTARTAAPFIPDGQIIVDVAKGIEPGTLFTMTQVLQDEIQKTGSHANVSFVALSGPTHAEEVALDLPTSIVASSNDPESARIVQSIFISDTFRVYTNDDLEGVELCGAAKNIIALAAGISDGLGYGDNTKAALITRGLDEITRLGLAMGCKEKTFRGLAGIGDLIVTATSRHSRNTRCGYLIGKGLPPQEAIRQVGMVVEGINALPAILQLAEKYHIELPITEGVYAVIKQGKELTSAVQELMSREGKPETIL